MTKNDDSDQKMRTKSKFVVLLLDQIKENGSNIQKICQNIKKSPQNLNYYLKKLIKVGFIVKRQSYPSAIYETTELGEKIKQKIEYSVGATYWRCHALQVGFSIEDYGSFTFDQIRTKEVRGWKFVDEKVKDSIGEWNIRIQSTSLMVISCPEKVTDDPDSYFAQMYQISGKLAEKYAESFKMKIGKMKVVRLGHKEMVGSERFADLFGKLKVEDVWIDNSTGSDRLEESQSSTKIEEVLEMPNRLSSLEKHLIRQTEIMDKFSENLELHLQVLQEIRDSFREWKDKR